MTGYGRSAARQPGSGEMSGEVEAVRIWLMGGFRVSVGSSRSIRQDEWHLRRPATCSSCSPWQGGTASTASF